MVVTGAELIKSIAYLRIPHCCKFGYSSFRAHLCSRFPIVKARIAEIKFRATVNSMFGVVVFSYFFFF